MGIEVKIKIAKTIQERQFEPRTEEIEMKIELGDELNKEKIINAIQSLRKDISDLVDKNINERLELAGRR